MYKRNQYKFSYGFCSFYGNFIVGKFQLMQLFIREND